MGSYSQEEGLGTAGCNTMCKHTNLSDDICDEISLLVLWTLDEGAEERHFLQVSVILTQQSIVVKLGEVDVLEALRGVSLIRPANLEQALQALRHTDACP